ncbi:MAG: hypothetical protein IJZ23_04990 [Roseburia sp.]|nr:hypothetical protein [Roseburia sp.]
MIVLNATPELKLTFDKLIQTMEANVTWNGLFVVIDNTLILQGDVRSLFFHFDSRKVVTNIIDLDIPVQKITPIENNDYVKNVINMLLYAFGKWGNIKGLTVEKDYDQLSKLFKNILGEMDIEPEYNKEHFWFYQKGVRILYEDVVECAISYKEKDPEVPEEESKGLWHKLIWKQTFEEFPVQETTVKERNRNRLGNNFYLTGYVCPTCNNKMYGVVYPVGMEFVIDTNEGRVQIARAYTCGKCCSFYTPRPRRLLIDGDSYIMDFEGDKVAYQDYQELLGKNGGKVCNPNYNTYVDRQKVNGAGAVSGRNPVMQVMSSQTEMPQGQQEAEEWILAEFREMLEEIDEIPTREFEHFFAKMTEGFFPEKAIEPIEKALWKKHEARQRGEKTSGGIKGYEKEAPDAKETFAVDDNTRAERRTEEGKSAQTVQIKKENKATQEKVERYKTRLNLFSRLSERQRNELLKQISADTVISESTREELLESAKVLKRQDNYEKLKEKVAGAKNKNRLVMLRIYGEIDDADLNESERKKLFDLTGLTLKDYREYLAERKDASGLREEKTGETSEHSVNKAVEEGTGRTEKVSLNQEHKIAKHTSRYQKKSGDVTTESVTKKTGIDRSAINKAADIREIESMIRQTKSTSRNDLQQLLENLQAQDFDKEVLEPYIEHVKAQMKRIDEAYLDSLMGDVLNLSSEEGVEVYEQIKEAQILPELKANALKQLEKRLSKIKADECELLVQKLQKEMAEAEIEEPDRHHYYPAKRVIMKEATEEEVEVIHYAKASYGAGMGLFEYPIWEVDTSLNRSGDKGMFITPENIYYSNLTTSYHISIFAIERVSASTGLLNRGLYVHQKNGEKTKLPYAVETSELPKLAEVLDAFVKYLQEKPFSRKEIYLAKEKHEEICCFRCGYIYKGTDTCPKCGYKTNQ